MDQPTASGPATFASTPEKELPEVLSREDLYALVWSEPMSRLSKRFGLSDVGLAKACTRMMIPVPGRGYWAKKDVGRAPRPTRLPILGGQLKTGHAWTLQNRPPAMPLSETG